MCADVCEEEMSLGRAIPAVIKELPATRKACVVLNWYSLKCVAFMKHKQ